MEAGTDQFPVVDLSRMLEFPKCAIRLASNEEAQILIHNAKIQFPDRVKNWQLDRTYYMNYLKDTCYTLFYDGESEPTTMSFANIQFFNEAGYEVIDFCELNIPMVEIEESDCSIEELIGVVAL